MTSFRDALKAALTEHETKRNRLTKSWTEIRNEINRVFGEAMQELMGATYQNENGDTSTLRWRDGYISFKRDDRLLEVVCVCSTSDVEEHYDPTVLTSEKIEEEVLSFVRSVLASPPSRPVVPTIIRR